MPVGGVATYYLRGYHPQESAFGLEQALVALIQYWLSRRSLQMHVPGNLEIVLVVDQRQVTLEITDPSVLDRLMGAQGASAVLDYLAKQMAMDRADAERLLNETQATVRVDTLRVPGQPNAWQPQPQNAPEKLEREVPSLLVGRLKTLDVNRKKGQPRSPEARGVIRQLIRLGAARSWTNVDLAKRTGVPASVLRAERLRLAGAPKEAKKPRLAKRGLVFIPEPPERAKADLPKRQRLSADKKREILDRSEQKKTAAAIAVEMRLPERTVRDYLERAKREKALAPARPEAAPGARPDKASRAAQRASFDQLVAEGLTPTEAGRAVGVPGRTARGWAKK